MPLADRPRSLARNEVHHSAPQRITYVRQFWILLAQHTQRISKTVAAPSNLFEVAD